jgi:hypothetical protein
MSSGNLGDEDGTDVEEFDSALNNRLIHINHTLDVQEWLGDYAEENCHPMITSYIKTHPEQMYKKSDDCKGKHHVLGLCYQSLSSVTTVKTHHLVSSCLIERSCIRLYWKLRDEVCSL